VRVSICGVRGSAPAPGVQFARHGGNTSCVAVGEAGEQPSLVLDAGTGLRRFSQLLDGRPFQGTILLGHLHWDHVYGLPFFRAAEHPESRTEVLIPAQGDARAILGRAMSPPHFPLRPEELRGDRKFGSLDPGCHTIAGFDVLALDIPHGGGRTFGYRVSRGDTALAYLSDHSPLTLGAGPDGLGEYHPAAVALARDVDLLIHDAQHSAAELPAKAFLGHSAVEYAVGLGEAAGARRVVLFHHDPDRTDEEIDGMVAALAESTVEVSAAVEGQVIDLINSHSPEEGA
jgi:phosphoribosyl 1,2-cyclic phosphodiesterase